MHVVEHDSHVEEVLSGGAWSHVEAHCGQEVAVGQAARRWAHVDAFQAFP